MPVTTTQRASFRPSAAELQQMKKNLKEQSSPAYLQKVINGLELKLKNLNQPGISSARAKDLRKHYNEQLAIYKNKLALAEKKLKTAYQRKAVWIAPVPPKPVDTKKTDNAKENTSYTRSGHASAAAPSFYDAKGKTTEHR